MTYIVSSVALKYTHSLITSRFCGSIVSFPTDMYMLFSSWESWADRNWWRRPGTFKHLCFYSSGFP